ncbi:MAG: FGGY-family carbohydrate kinase [Gammaproteobacteria bacterium]
MTFFLGIDIGTSACRSCVIDADAVIQAEVRTPLPAPLRSGAGVEQDPQCWWQALTDNLDELAGRVALSSVGAISLDATSSTLLLCDADGRPLAPALMYNDARAIREAGRLERIVPVNSAAHGASASLAKLLWLRQSPAGRQARFALHQADWLIGRLSGQFGVSDENNALKLGYDIIRRRWPDWLARLDIPPLLFPEVVPAGRIIGRLGDEYCRRWGFTVGTRVTSGTTDSTASFMATRATAGGAVTSLGSTLVLKVLTREPLFAPENGIYSHRLGNLWLAGGASNSGGAVLLRYFSLADIKRLTALLQPDRPTGLDYYPLLSPGERFPLNDPLLAPRLEPRPDDDAVFFQGMLEGIAAIEKSGYRRLAQLGAPWPEKVITTGGGAANHGWQSIRARQLGIPVVAAEHQQAAYGAALLARSSAAFPA